SAAPVETPVNHWPLSSTRPITSALPSPVRSPSCTSTQVTSGDHVAQRLVRKDVPVDRPAHHWPVSCTRPMRSALPSPFRSPTLTSTHVTSGDQTSHREVVKWPAPSDRATYHWPPCR